MVGKVGSGSFGATSGDPNIINLGENETTKKMLESCRNIANYYAANNYTYDKDHPVWTANYLEQQARTSCCSIYVLQVLYDCGLASDLGEMDVGYLQNTFFPGNPNWVRIDAKSEADLKPGDVQIYKNNGGSHTNIYAGNGRYWDAGKQGVGAFVGTTITFGMEKYTCSYRYIGYNR